MDPCHELVHWLQQRDVYQEEYDRLVALVGQQVAVELVVVAVEQQDAKRAVEAVVVHVGQQDAKPAVELGVVHVGQ